MRHARSLKFPRRTSGLLLLSVILAACGDEDPSGPIEEPFASLTVQAETDWTYVELDATAGVVQPSDPASSTAWDVAFFATGVMLNGGAAGPGEVQGYCLCQNDGATNDQVLAMTAESERAAFEAVTAASIPAEEDAWLADVLAPAIAGWWSYDMTSHTVTPVTDRVWIVRTAEGEAFAKLRVTGMANGSQQSAGDVTLEFAVQPTGGEPYGATRTLTVNVGAAPVYVDLLDGGVSDASDWDLRLEGYDIRLNGGVSGAGEGQAVLAGDDFATVPLASEVPAGWTSDGFGGVFEAHPWYRYNLEGNHQIWPTYDVYLIRRGEEIHKVQLVSYYNPTNGDDRHITFRYAPLTD
jgi:HmuY protein